MRIPPLAAARRLFLRTAAALSVAYIRPPASHAANAGGRVVGVVPPPFPATITLPLYCMGSAFCTEYYIDGQRFRAVVDTGSPFLLVDGSVTSTFERWGRFLGDDVSVPLGDFSGEAFGGQDVDVEWRRGSLRLAGYLNARVAARNLWDRVRGARAGAWTTPSASDAIFEPINFGVVRRYEGRMGGGAIYLGLAKDRGKRMRPTFLEQTDIQSLQFDFIRRTLTLARRPMLGPRADAIPLVDLRPLGAPVGAYALAVHRLLCNGKELPLARKAVAIIDTGTTGLVISDSLYDSDEMPLPGAAVRAMDVEVLTESGRVVTLSAARLRRRPGDGPGEVELVEAANPVAPPRAESFPLITTPVDLTKWFERSPTAGGAAPPHVLFLGLAFLSRLRLTIDADERRLSAQIVDQVREA